MRIIELDAAARGPVLDALVALWSASVRTTHDFLTEEEIERIAGYVPQALTGIPSLWAAVEESDDADAAASASGEGTEPAWLGFLGVDGDAIEMLFVSHQAQGTGVGTALIEQARRAGATRVTVNEQNTAARGFYERRGFEVYDRQDTDDQGGPYPVLRMRLTSEQPGERRGGH